MQFSKGDYYSMQFSKGGLFFKRGLLFHAISKRGPLSMQFSKGGLLFHCNFPKGAHRLIENDFFFPLSYVYSYKHSAVWNNSPTFENCNAIFKRGTIIPLQFSKGAIITCNFQKGGLLCHCNVQKMAIIKGGLLFHAIFKRGTIYYSMQFSQWGYSCNFQKGTIIPCWFQQTTFSDAFFFLAL